MKRHGNSLKLLLTFYYEQIHVLLNIFLTKLVISEILTSFLVE
jgi:hypothetical protein